MRFWYNLKIRNKVLIVLLPSVLVSICTVSYLSVNASQNALKKAAFNQLIAVRELKANQLEDYFTKIRHQISTFSENQMIIDAMADFNRSFDSVGSESALSDFELNSARRRLDSYYASEFLPKLAQNKGEQLDKKDYFPKTISTTILQDLYISNNTNPLGSKHLLDRAPDNSQYSRFHEKYHPTIRSYLERFGYYDIFLIEPNEGYIVYSVFKEADYATSLDNGPYANSNFAQAFDAARNSDDKDAVKLEDFQPYEPSYYAPASFISSPIYKDSELIGIAVFQMPIEAINNIMTSNGNWEETGLGKTGETYVVGNDYKLKTESRFLLENPEGYLNLMTVLGMEKDVSLKIQTTNSAIGRQVVKTDATKRAVSGETGANIIKDYRNISVLSAFKPLDIKDVNWAIISEIDEEEAFSAIKDLTQFVVLSTLVGLILISTIIAAFVRLSITRPIGEMLDAIFDLRAGNGDLTLRLPDFGNDEIGQTAKNLNGFIEQLQNLMQKLKAEISELAQASHKVNSTAKRFRENASAQAIAIEQTSSALTQMAVSIKQNAENASTTNQLAKSSSKQTADGGIAVEKTVAAMKDISSRINMISDFAYKTDLLALNAMIEAARYGDAGEGFAVVADSVGSLAEMSQTEAKEISDLTIESVKIAESAGSIVSGTVPNIQKTAQLVQEISSASDEQSLGVSEISDAMKQLDKTASSGSKTSEELEATSDRMQKMLDQIQDQISFFKT